MKDWKIVIITHGPVFEEFYKYDSSFNKDRYVLSNLSDKIIHSDFLNVLNRVELEQYRGILDV